MAIILVTVAGLALFQIGSPAAKPTKPVQMVPRRALMIQSSVLLDDLAKPSYSELRSIGVTELGTNVYADFKPEWWSKLAAWNAEANTEGFETFAFINDPNNLELLVAKSINSGFDGIEFDELVSSGLLDRPALLAAISHARKISSDVWITITEYDEGTLTSLLSWTREISNIRIATSDYNNLNTATTLARSVPAGIRAGMWVIFVPDPKWDWAAYRDLDSWLSHAKTMNADLLLWVIDANGTWVQNWPRIVALLNG